MKLLNSPSTLAPRTGVCACALFLALIFFLSFSAVPRQRGCPKGFCRPRLPLCARRARPVSTLRAAASPPTKLRSSVHRIKLPCRRVHLAFYGLICLAATVTTSHKTSSIFVREISTVCSVILSRHQRRTSNAQSLLSSLFFFFFFVVSVFPLYSSNGKR